MKPLQGILVLCCGRQIWDCPVLRGTRHMIDKLSATYGYAQHTVTTRIHHSQNLPVLCSWHALHRWFDQLNDQYCTFVRIRRCCCCPGPTPRAHGLCRCPRGAVSLLASLLQPRCSFHMQVENKVCPWPWRQFTALYVGPGCTAAPRQLTLRCTFHQ